MCEMICYSGIKEGDELEICGDGAPGFATLGERVTVVHVFLDAVVVSDQTGRWAKFVGATGAARLRFASVRNRPTLRPETLEM
jgi:hypothetical protein